MLRGVHSYVQKHDIETGRHSTQQTVRHEQTGARTDILECLVCIPRSMFEDKNLP